MQKLSEVTGHFQTQIPLRFRAAQFESIVGPYSQVCKKKSIYFVVFGKGYYRLWAPDKPEVAVMQSKAISDVSEIAISSKRMIASQAPLSKRSVWSRHP